MLVVIRRSGGRAGVFFYFVLAHLFYWERGEGLFRRICFIFYLLVSFYVVVMTRAAARNEHLLSVITACGRGSSFLFFFYFFCPRGFGGSSVTEVVAFMLARALCPCCS